MSPRARKKVPVLAAKIEPRPADGGRLSDEEYRRCFEAGRRMRLHADAARAEREQLDRLEN